MPLLHKSQVVDEAGAGRADLLVRQLTGLPRRQISAMFEHGCVQVNGRSDVRDFTPLKPGDRLELRYDPETRYRPKPAAWRSSAFTIVFEDEHLLVVDKAAWVLSVPAEGDTRQTLQDAVNTYLKHRGLRAPARIVHRLDRGTSGLLVVAKSADAARGLKVQFEAHSPRREYLALVAGTLPKERGRFESHLATGDNLDRYSTRNPEQGELAITHYQVEQQRPDVSLVRCKLETGRRNQIRVHFAEVSHPVIGDPRYQPKLARHPRWRYKRLALHAAVLGFAHPINGKPLLWESPLPREFEAVIGRQAPAARSRC